MAEFSEMLKKRVVLELPEMNKSKVKKDLVYKEVDGIRLTTDIYYPADFSGAESLPAVIFIHGDAPWELLQNIKESGQYASWGQLVAAKGLIGITFTHRSTNRFTDFTGPTEDILDLFEYVQRHANELNIDQGNLGIWVCSAGGPTGLTAALKARPEWAKCLVSYYAMMDLHELADHLPEEAIKQYSASSYLTGNSDRFPPMYVVKAGLDKPIFNNSIDRFVKEANRRELPIQVVEHTSGHHAFEILDDNERSKEIISDTLSFFCQHLMTTAGHTSR